MFQLRWANLDVGVKVLQYRTQYTKEVWGSPAAPGEPHYESWHWTDWQDVPTVFVSKEERLESINGKSQNQKR